MTSVTGNQIFDRAIKNAEYLVIELETPIFSWRALSLCLEKEKCWLVDLEQAGDAPLMLLPDDSIVFDASTILPNAHNLKPLCMELEELFETKVYGFFQHEPKEGFCAEVALSRVFTADDVERILSAWEHWDTDSNKIPFWARQSTSGWDSVLANVRATQIGKNRYVIHLPTTHTLIVTQNDDGLFEGWCWDGEGEMFNISFDSRGLVQCPVEECEIANTLLPELGIPMRMLEFEPVEYLAKLGSRSNVWIELLT